MASLYVDVPVILRATEHTVSLGLTQDANKNSRINLSESATDYKFSGTISATGGFHGGVTIGLKKGAIIVGEAVAPTVSSATVVAFEISVPSSGLSQGSNTLRLFGVRPGSNLSPFDFFSFNVVVDTIRPTSSFVQIASPINTRVSNATINFSEAIVASTFDTSDVSLIRNGNSVPLSGLDFNANGGNSFSIGNLGNFTSIQGNYELRVANAGIIDAEDNPGNTTASVAWTVDLDPPSFSDPPRLATDLDTGLSNSDAVTMTQQGLSFSTSVTGVDAAGVVRLEIRTLAGVLVSSVVATPTAVANERNGVFVSTIFPGEYRVFAIATDGSGNTTTSNALALTIDRTPPAKPRLSRDNTDRKIIGNALQPTTANVQIDVGNAEAGARIILGRDNAVNVQQRTPSPNIAITSINDSPANVNAKGQTLRYTATQTDLAGNVSSVSDSFFAVIDSVLPSINSIALTSLDPALNSNALAVSVTKNEVPEFNLDLTDEKYALADNPVVIDVFRSESPSARIGGTTVNLPSLGLANGGAHTTFSFNAKINLIAGIRLEAGEAGKQHNLVFKITDAAKQTSSRTFSVFVAKESGASLSSPATPVDTTYYFLGARLVSSDPNNGKAGSATITVNQKIRIGANIRLFNEANNDSETFKAAQVSGDGPFTVTLAASTPEAELIPGSNRLIKNFPTATTKISWLRPWTMSFDKTTQTTWFSNEDGHYIGQFDPATESVKLYDIVLPDTIGGAPSYDPHGVFFDFNTHLTPRVWFVYRNGVDGSGDSQPASDGGGVNKGRLAYLDVVTQKLFTFDLSAIPFANSIKGTHAIFIDSRGHAWISAEDANAVIEIDLQTLPNGDSNSNLNSLNGSVIVHELPKKLGDIGDQDFPFQIHGIQVVVDNRTSQPYVWLTDGNPFSTGRTVLLRPGSHATNSLNKSRSMDEWFEWNVNDALTSESRLTKNPDGTFAARAHPLFLGLDDNETPGIPEDDRIINPDGGGIQKGGTAGVIRVLDANNLVGQLTKLDPSSFFNESDLPVSSPILSTIVPKIPGASPDNTFAAPSQGSVDRSGTIYFNDQIGSIARLNFDDASLKRTKIDAPIRYFKTGFQVAPISLSDTSPSAHSIGVERLISSGATTTDRSQVPGVDQYELAQKSHRSRGEGAYRFVLNAENTVHSTLSQSDHIAITAFAESNRRNVAVLESPFPLPNGARIGGRAVLQVLRDGSVVLTARGDGELLDVQVNLTKALLNAGKIASFEDAAVLGDMAALVNADGAIEALGRLADGRLIRYTFTPPTKAWKTVDLKNVAFWTANTKLTIPSGQLAAEDPAPALGIGFTITTSSGHLIVIPSGGTPVDLSAAPGRPAVYSGVGGVRLGDKLRFYGTNQTGSVIEYTTDLNFGNVSTRTLVLPSTADVRETRMLRNIRPLIDGTTLHLFATDGVSRLVHYELNASGTVTLAENVTQVVQNSGEVYGYFNFLQQYGGRVYTYVSAIRQTDGALRVYGTNGGELVEFTRDTTGKWRVGNLTNDINSTHGTATGSRTPANFVFGSPSVYHDQLRERHILQINADGEIIEYYTLANDPQSRFHTQNVNLRIGEDSLITNLRFRATSLQTTASVSSNSAVGSASSTGGSASNFAAPYFGSLDVNADGELSPLDVLIVINYLNASTDTDRIGDGESSTNRLDVNGDGWVSPLDVLILVNQLNTGSGNAGGEGEGDASSSDTDLITAAAIDLAFTDLGPWDNLETSVKKQRGIHRR